MPGEEDSKLGRSHPGEGRRETDLPNYDYRNEVGAMRSVGLDGTGWAWGRAWR